MSQAAAFLDHGWSLLKRIWAGGRRRNYIEFQCLVVGFILVLGTWAAIQLVDEVVKGDTRTFDEWVMRSLRQDADISLPIGPRWLRMAGADLSGLGDPAILLFVILAVAGWLFLERKFHAMWFVLAAALGGQIMSSVFKILFARERPDIVPHLVEVSSASFPSGHSMMSAVVYLTLGALLVRLEVRRRTRIYSMTIAVLATVLVGFSRIYLGVHFPTDVLAGWLIGLMWALLCWIVVRILQQRGAVEDPEADHPELARK
jgi:undecaprenyl-diphosphatase